MTVQVMLPKKAITALEQTCNHDLIHARSELNG